MDMVNQEKGTLDRIIELNDQEKAEFEKKVQSRKKSNASPDARPKFKPASSQEYQD